LLFISSIQTTGGKGLVAAHQWTKGYRHQNGQEMQKWRMDDAFLFFFFFFKDDV